MNDWHEVEYGRRMLLDIYHSETGANLKAAMNKVDEKFVSEFENDCNALIVGLERNAYILCISEHGSDEDEFGRLSMWRAYGGKCGVAVVLNPTAFATNSDILGAYSSPVLYYNKDDVENIIINLTKAFEEAHALIKVPEFRYQVLFYLKYIFRILCLCVKHPGFREEREWRIFHVKFENSQGKLIYETKSLNGFPQSVCILKLEDHSAEGYAGTGISDLVKKIIIGPTEFAEPTRDCFLELMTDHGIKEAAAKLVISGIPLRQ